MMKNLTYGLIFLTIFFWSCSPEDIPVNSLGPEGKNTLVNGQEVALSVDEELLLSAVSSSRTDSSLEYFSALRNQNCAADEECLMMEIQFSVDLEIGEDSLFQHQRLPLSTASHYEYVIESITNIDEGRVEYSFPSEKVSIRLPSENSRVGFISLEEETEIETSLASEETTLLSTTDRISVPSGCNTMIDPFEIFKVADSDNLLVRLSREAKELYGARWSHTGEDEDLMIKNGTLRALYDCSNRIQGKDLYVADGEKFFYTRTQGDFVEGNNYPIDASFTVRWRDGKIYRSEWSPQADPSIVIKDSYGAEFFGQDFQILLVDIDVILKNRNEEELTFMLEDGLIYLKKQ